MLAAHAANSILERSAGGTNEVRASQNGVTPRFATLAVAGAQIEAHLSIVIVHPA
jgi:hypothetical protein